MKNILMAFGLSVASLAALAAGADQIGVAEPTVRLVPPGAQVSAAFMVLRNSGERDVRLVTAASPAARTVELHNHINDNGVMRMRQVPAIEIKGKGEAALKPGGLHIMLIGLQQPLKEGGSVPLTLNFDDGSSKQVEAKVVRPGEPPAGMHHDHKH